MGGVRRDMDHPVRQAFLDWLLTPTKDRDPKSLRAFAEKYEVPWSTLQTWRTRDREFMEEWEKRYLATVGSPERKQTILDTLFRTASDYDDPKHVQAAKAYFDIVEDLAPVKMKVEVTRPATDLTDDELDTILAERIGQEQQRRRAG